MSTRSDSAARRHLERHLRQLGHTRGYVKRLATLLPIREVRKLLPLWRRALAATGRMPTDGLADPTRTASETEADRGRGQNLTACPCDTTPTLRMHKTEN